jgi:hypothetical protein
MPGGRYAAEHYVPASADGLPGPRRLVLPLRVGNWSLTSLQQRLVRTGGRLIKQAHYYWLLLAEGHVMRRLFGAMVRRIAKLEAPSG